MSLTVLEKANLRRLKSCVIPNERKIERIKDRLRKQAEKAQQEIRELEAMNADYNALIEKLEEKEREVDNENSSEDSEVEEPIINENQFPYEEDTSEEPEPIEDILDASEIENSWPGVL